MNDSGTPAFICISL